MFTPCVSCRGKTKSGAACSRSTCKYAPFCWQHSSVEVKRSTIPGAGRGLFAKRDIKKDQKVGDYTVGTEKLTGAQYTERYPNRRSTHVAKVGNYYYDATNPKRNVAGMANRKPGGNNLKLKSSGALVANKNIRAGSELYLAYGGSYRPIR